MFHHVIARFVDRGWFFTDNAERERYLHYLGRALERSDWFAVAYALMSNHIHLGLIAGEQPIGSLLKRTHSPFARWMNKRHERIGPLFADRPATWAIRPEHVGATIAYIHNNPVRASVVAAAIDSHWTSARAYAGAASIPAWLRVEEGLSRSGLAPTELSEITDLAGPDARAELARIQRAAHRRGAVELATPTAMPTVVPLVARPFARVRPEPRDILDAVGAFLNLRPTRFSSRSHDAASVRARTIAAHAGRELGLVHSDIASALGITRQATARLAARQLDASAVAVVRLVCEQLTSVPPSPAKGAQRQGLIVRRS